MNFEYLAKYGSFRHKFEGSGSVTFHNNQSHNRPFYLGQRNDGALIFGIELDEVPFAFPDFPRDLSIREITCLLSDGRSVDFYGQTIISEYAPSISIEEGYSKVNIVGFTNQWEIGSKEPKEYSIAIFELVNFLFIGTQSEEVIEDGYHPISLSQMPVFLGDRKTLFKQLPDYDQIRKMLKAQKGVFVTCKALMDIESELQIEDLIYFMDVICDLTSICRGTLISWTSLDLLDSDGHSSYSILRNSVTREYTAFGTINETDRAETIRFIENGYEVYEEIKEHYRAREITRAYTDTRSSGFLETRSMLIGVLLDYLASKRARIEDRLTFMPDDEFKSNLDTLKQRVNQVLQETYPELNSEYINGGILPKLNGFNQRPLSWKLRRLMKFLKIDSSDQEISSFIGARNGLAHEGRFPPDREPVECFRQMIHLLDRVVLRLFNYRGRYFNYENSQYEEI